METTEEENGPRDADDSAEIERLKKELKREHDLHLRALADYENYRKRVERERATVARAGKRELILAMLDLLDDFDRALQHTGEAPLSVAEGLEALHRKFISLLQAQGVAPMVTIGEVFNPQFHDAIGLVDSEEVAPGAVAEEVQRGYFWGDEVLRPARVRVAQ